MTTPKTITMANLRRSGGDAFMDVATNRTRYVVTSHRRPLVAVVPLEDLERLERMSSATIDSTSPNPSFIGKGPIKMIVEDDDGDMAEVYSDGVKP